MKDDHRLQASVVAGVEDVAVAAEGVVVERPGTGSQRAQSTATRTVWRPAAAMASRWSW